MAALVRSNALLWRGRMIAVDLMVHLCGGPQSLDISDLWNAVKRPERAHKCRAATPVARHPLSDSRMASASPSESCMPMALHNVITSSSSTRA